MLKAKAIVPKKRLTAAIARKVVDDALDDSAHAARRALELIVTDWAHHVAFEVSAPSPDVREAATEDEVFLFQDGGTKRHEIRPRKKRFLRFQTGSGEVAFARRVNHPGTKAMGYSKKVAEFAQRDLKTRLDRGFEEATR